MVMEGFSGTMEEGIQASSKIAYSKAGEKFICKTVIFSKEYGEKGMENS